MGGGGGEVRKMRGNFSRVLIVRITILGFLFTKVSSCKETIIYKNTSISPIKENHLEH